MKNLLILIILILPFIAYSQSSLSEQTTCNRDSILFIADQMPEFPGGEIALRKYIAKNLKYPKVPAEEVNIGKIYIKFCVNKKGGVEMVTVVRTLHPKFDRAAIKVVRSLPKWKPGKNQGKAVCVWYTIPIHFHWK